MGHRQQNSVASGAILFAYMNFIKNEKLPLTPIKMKVIRMGKSLRHKWVNHHGNIRTEVTSSLQLAHIEIRENQEFITQTCPCNIL